MDRGHSATVYGGEVVGTLVQVITVSASQREALVMLAEESADAALVAQMTSGGTRFAGRPTDVDVSPPVSAPRSVLPDGSPASIEVIDDWGSPVGELLLWIQSGRIFSVEQTWYTDEPPTALPGRRNVRSAL